MQFGLFRAESGKSSDISYFYGINRTKRPRRGEFTDMHNMSSCEYLCISPRGKRERVVTAPGVISAVTAPDSTNVSDISAFTGISEGVFYYNGVGKSAGYSLNSDFKWEIARKGNLYIINGFKSGHDKVSYSAVMYYYNIDTDTFGAAGKKMDKLILSAGTDSKGNYLATFRYGFDAVKEYTASDGAGTVIRNSDSFDIYANGGRVLPSGNIFEKVFSIGEEVSVSGFPKKSENFGQVWTYSSSKAETVPQTNQDFSLNNTIDTDAYAAADEPEDTQIVKAVVDDFDVSTMSVEGTQVYIHKIYFKLYGKNGSEVDFDNMSGTLHYYCSGVTIEKRTRRFDNIAVHNGRIWGTIPTGNMIYASSSDDIFSFSSEDIALKFAARIPSDSPGVFTGMCEYNGELILFKENSITVIYGNRVSNYAVSVIYGIGCLDKRSIQVTPEGVIFLSGGGFYIYSGSIPKCISQKLASTYFDAVSGFDGNVYYACVSEGDNKIVLAYDLRYGLWHICDSTYVSGFFKFRNGFYLADERYVYKTDSGDMDEEWSFTSVKQNDGTLDNKAVNEMWIRAEAARGASFKVESSVDGGEFRTHASFDCEGHKIFRCPIRAEMGHDFVYRISGRGKVVFYEIEIKRADGGRRFKEYE